MVDLICGPRTMHIKPSQSVGDIVFPVKSNINITALFIFSRHLASNSSSDFRGYPMELTSFSVVGKILNEF